MGAVKDKMGVSCGEKLLKQCPAGTRLGCLRRLTLAEQIVTF
jgi:hypothetical protein